jgi:hypothetical protein
MWKRFQLAPKPKTGHGTAFTALMSPQRSSWCTPEDSGSRQHSGTAASPVQGSLDNTDFDCMYVTSSKPAVRACRFAAICQASERTLAVVAQAADARLARPGARQHVV